MKMNKLLCIAGVVLLIVSVLGFVLFRSNSEPENTAVSVPEVQKKESSQDKQLVLDLDDNNTVVSEKSSSDITLVDLPLSDAGYELPDISRNLAETSDPVLRHILRDRAKGQPERTEYAYITSFEELKSITDEWHYLRKHNLGIYSKTNDLLFSAVRFAAENNDNWSLSNYYLGTLFLDNRNYENAAMVFKNIMDASDTVVDESIRQRAILKLAMIEFAKSTSFWRRRKMESVIYHGRSANDSARQLFKLVRESKILVQTEMGADIRKIADYFLMALDQRKDDPRKELDDIAKATTNILLVREIYNMARERGNCLTDAMRASRSSAYKTFIETSTTEDKRIWCTYTGFAIFSLKDYQGVINLLEPMLDSGIWDNKMAYVNVQYYLAYSYQKIGNIEKARSIASKLVSEGFEFKAMTPEKKLFFDKIQN